MEQDQDGMCRLTKNGLCPCGVSGSSKRVGGRGKTIQFQGQGGRSKCRDLGRCSVINKHIKKDSHLIFENWGTS